MTPQRVANLIGLYEEGPGDAPEGGDPELYIERRVRRGHLPRRPHCAVADDPL